MGGGGREGAAGSRRRKDVETDGRAGWVAGGEKKGYIRGGREEGGWGRGTMASSPYQRCVKGAGGKRNEGGYSERRKESFVLSIGFGFAEMGRRFGSHTSLRALLLRRIRSVHWRRRCGFTSPTIFAARRRAMGWLTPQAG